MQRSAGHQRRRCADERRHSADMRKVRPLSSTSAIAVTSGIRTTEGEIGGLLLKPKRRVHAIVLQP
ncbi:hypothetical protein SNOG_08745 [Parastagonospora nodorum SN15]|uniref:Uncharacterized protein n=1 Tax=Phaeosphaeria nodorum (strain SN15 / ATCC MYA-4574 / FGSC 10173) TaxID=321614 RepID=Q0UHL9_PHANO|nr:hypothetical protein SNOG_08745 [Parastagonospora nodorum SN15]EAT83913.2 hypothetical protein SNOG_08745 [Parastagonospora nodorum SN15]